MNLRGRVHVWLSQVCPPLGPWTPHSYSIVLAAQVALKMHQRDCFSYVVLLAVISWTTSLWSSIIFQKTLSLCDIPPVVTFISQIGMGNVSWQRTKHLNMSVECSLIDSWSERQQGGLAVVAIRCSSKSAKMKIWATLRNALSMVTSADLLTIILVQV